MDERQLKGVTLETENLQLNEFAFFSGRFDFSSWKISMLTFIIATNEH